MKKAILHIGTEKTGTTSIQKFLYENRIKLGANGLLFPASAGFISNQLLVVYGKKEPEQDIAPPTLDVKDAAALSVWKENFVQNHCAEIIEFQKRHTNSTVVYSAEHLQSRLTSLEEIKRVARLLRPLYDEISVLVYVRRQDIYARSAHSTSVRGGEKRPFSFDNIHAGGPYYNYRLLLENWSEVFGADTLNVRLFEKPRLIGKNVVSDFESVTGIDKLSLPLLSPESVNEALSYTGLSLLRRFNSLDQTDPRLLGYSKPELRGFMLKAVENISDNHGRIMPSKSAALAFYERYRVDNQWIADQWLAGDGFNDNFDDYPEIATAEPNLPALDDQLDELLLQFSESRAGQLSGKGYVSNIGSALKQRLRKAS